MPTKSKRPKATGTGSEDWLTRRAELRQMEWALHRALLDAGQQALTRWAEKAEEASPAEIARFIAICLSDEDEEETEPDIRDLPPDESVDD
jgi:hypothetical protein